MRVKVSPPYEGAGSFEIEAEESLNKMILFTTKHEPIDKTWCEPIPSIIPEPGDICEFKDTDTCSITMGIYNGPGDYRLCPTSCKIAWHEIRVLARKPLGFKEVEKEFVAIFNRCGVSYRGSYEALVALILGGAEYGRVDK